jgi:hypothetical protein
MLEKEKSIREEIEKTGDLGGDLRLELAECLITQEKYDEACENLLRCLDADTMVRDCAYPLIVDLLAKGKCIDLVPHMTFEWLRLECYIEPEKKKAMYMGIAFGSEKLNKVATAMECYIMDFGGDENVGAMYDRLENLTFEQMPNADYYDYYYFELAHNALCEAVWNDLDLSKLSDERLACMAGHTDDDEMALEINAFILENGNRDILRRNLFCDAGNGLEKTIRLAQRFIEQENYEAVTWIYTETKSDGPWDWEEANEGLYAPIIDFILETNDIEIVSKFLAANASGLGSIDYELQYKICEFVNENYPDEDGSIQKEWSDLTAVYTMIVCKIFDVAAGVSDLDEVNGEYSSILLKNAFESCRNMLTDEAVEACYAEWNGELTFDGEYGSGGDVEDKEEFLSNLREALKTLEEEYFI